MRLGFKDNVFRIGAPPLRYIKGLKGGRCQKLPPPTVNSIGMSDTWLFKRKRNGLITHCVSCGSL